jgi:hypothetical protein
MLLSADQVLFATMTANAAPAHIDASPLATRGTLLLVLPLLLLIRERCGASRTPD